MGLNPDPLSGYNNYGLENLKNVKLILKYSIVTTFILSAIIYSIVFFEAGVLTSVFNSDGNIELSNYAIHGLKIYFASCPFVGINIVLAIFFISTEKAVFAQIISMLRGFIVLIPMAFLLSAVWGMTGVWCAYPMTEVFVSIVGVIFYFRRTGIAISNEQQGRAV